MRIWRISQGVLRVTSVMNHRHIDDLTTYLLLRILEGLSGVRRADMMEGSDLVRLGEVEG